MQEEASEAERSACPTMAADAQSAVPEKGAYLRSVVAGYNESQNNVPIAAVCLV